LIRPPSFMLKKRIGNQDWQSNVFCDHRSCSSAQFMHRALKKLHKAYKVIVIISTPTLSFRDTLLTQYELRDNCSFCFVNALFFEKVCFAHT
jgi:hypothetical protein